MATNNQSQSSTLKGYNLLANMKARYPSLSIYRRFISAHHFDLLLQEAELNYLLVDLGVAKLEDLAKTEGDFRTFDTDFENLYKSRHIAHEFSQWTKLMVVRAKLKEYGDHLLQMHALQNLPHRNSDDVKTLRDWYQTEGGANFCPKDYDTSILDTSTEYDLTSLNSNHEHQDALSRFFEGKALTWLDTAGLYKLRDKYVTIKDTYLDAEAKTRMTVYSDQTIRIVVSVLSAALSSLLPTMSIFVLYYVQNQLLRLELILAFTVLFSVIVTLLTSNKRSECFAAAAAFAAVLVVFVSGNNGDGNNTANSSSSN